MTAVEAADLAAFLAERPPFDSLGPDALKEVVRGARVERFHGGALIHDAFTKPTDEVFVVLAGQVNLQWNDRHGVLTQPDEVLEPGQLFGFSAMLTERSIGPRAVAAGGATVARIPGALAGPAFATRRGARFLAETISASPRAADIPTYGSVDELIEREPLVVDGMASVTEVAARMTEQGVPAAVVRIEAEHLGLVTDSVLRAEVLAAGRPTTTRVHQILDTTVPTVDACDSAAEALILMLERDAEYLLVTDRTGRLHGVVCPRDFAISPITVGVSLHERMRRATSIDDLATFAGRVPRVLGDLMSRGLASTRAIAVYSSFLDTIVRQAIGLVFARHPELSVDAFTWLSLGSNGRREAVLSSDVDSAVAFDDAVGPDAIVAYRAAFAEVYKVLATAGLSADDHGAIAQRAPFARTNADWRTAGKEWLAAPAEHNGAMMTSLLVDARPIHGDPGLPAVTRVVSDLREHPATMRLLLRESLSYRAKLRSAWFPARRRETFDLKSHALLPVVNIARWAALSAGSAVLPTIERLEAASGSAMLPAEAASTLIDVFEVLQGLRLRHQMHQYQAGERPSDLVTLGRLSPLDRTVIEQAVREIALVQRRMDNVSNYVAVEEWASRERE
ncbi:MAG: putative nucleotidyltransferase substrate binding domain-containing protein [Actinomycetes bacterium]